MTDRGPGITINIKPQKSGSARTAANLQGTFPRDPSVPSIMLSAIHLLKSPQHFGRWGLDDSPLTATIWKWELKHLRVYRPSGGQSLLTSWPFAESRPPVKREMNLSLDKVRFTSTPEKINLNRGNVPSARGRFQPVPLNRVLLNKVKQLGTMWQKQETSGSGAIHKVVWVPPDLTSWHQSGPSSLSHCRLHT